MNIIEQAKAFAIAAHEACEQKRNYTGEPYWTHPEEVAHIVATHGGTPEMIAAAWLHDVVEDTPIKLDTIRDLFGNAVADLVDWLTDVSKPNDGPRVVRRTLDRIHTAQAPADAQTIKLADLIANSRTIVAFDPSFAKTYLIEKQLLLRVLYRGDPVLRAEAEKLLVNNRFDLGLSVEELDKRGAVYLAVEKEIVAEREKDAV